MHISLKFMFRFFSFFLLICKFFLFLFRLKDIALIVATSCWAVRSPIAHTDPAELVTAVRNPASHMIASLVFFDSSLTFRAWFCISHNPGEIFRLSCIFITPLLNNIAVTRLMTFFRTLKTRFLPAITLNVLLNRIWFPLKAPVTSLFATPSDHFIIIGEWLDERSPVLFSHCFIAFQYLEKVRMANLHIATLLHAQCRGAVYTA